MIGGGSLVLGLLLVGVELACAFAVAARLVRRRAGEPGPVSILAHAVLITAFLIAVHVVPGAFGVMNRWTVPGTSAVALVAVLALTRTRDRTDREHGWPTDSGLSAGRATGRHTAVGTEGVLAWLFALAVVGLVVGYVGGFLRTEFGTVPVGIDALTFHLPDVASWMRTGSLWQIDQFTPGLANGNYPNNGDVLFLFLVLPFRSALLVRATMLPYLLLIALAVFAIARELGASRPSAITFGAAVCAIPSVAWPALIDTETDTLMLFGFTAAIAFLLRHARTRSGFDLAVAGVAFGISFGTKWYAVPFVAVAVLVWALGQRLSGERGGQIVRGGAWLTGLTLVFGGFWLLRNLVESGDPFFPLRVAPFGVTLFDAPPDIVQELGGFTIADYFTAPHILGAFIWPALRDALQALGLVIGGGGLVAGVVAAWGLRRPGRRERAGGRVLLLALTVVLLAIVYAFTPDTALGPRNLPVQAEANVRYLMPALVLAAPLAAWLCTRLGRPALLVQAAVLALTVKSLSRIYPTHWKVLIVLGLIAVSAGIGWRAASRRRSGRSGLRRLSAAAVYGLLLLALIAAGVAARSRFSYQTYARADATLGWLLARAPTGHTVGLANVWSNDGLSPVLPAFGPRLGNRVSFVGPFVRHLLGQYSSAQAFDRALRRGNYDLLEIGLGFPTPQPRVLDEVWAQRAGYREIAQSPRLALFYRGTVSRRR